MQVLFLFTCCESVKCDLLCRSSAAYLETVKLTYQPKFLKLANSLRLPWFFDRRHDKHFVIEVAPGSLSGMSDSLNCLIVRVLSLFPPGRVRFLFIDPVGLGKNFANFHSLADYDDKVISSRVWSDRQHIRNELSKIVEHIETVVQKYLRADYDSIDDYNAAEGQIAEPHYFVVINGFPENFDADACLSLERIMSNGPKCGVHVLMLWDTGKALPHGVNKPQILQGINSLTVDDKGEMAYVAPNGVMGCVHLKFDKPLSPEIFSKIVKSHGERAAEGARVEVTFKSMLDRVTSDPPTDWGWSGEAWMLSNAKSLIAPLGPTGARKTQYLTLGKSGTTAHHTLLIGKTGSGKSNLLHVMIMSMAELYSPEELELYLIDFKKGVEFKDYADSLLPHARVIAIESEVEFGISVLRGLDAELARRGTLFRNEAVSELGEYRQKTRKNLPRSVMIIDEFHELINEEGPASREAVAILERIVRQGRSFGMHLVLASQSIAGVRLPKAILDQIGVRIAMQCSDADSRLVLSEDNPAARLLNRAGEAIYNDKNGRLEGNNVFQAALLTSDGRKALLKSINVHAKTSRQGRLPIEPPFIFEGNQSAKFEECRAFGSTLSYARASNASAPDLWVGEPIAMLPAHAIPLKRQSGSHLLVLTRDEQQGFGVVYGSVLSLFAQRRSDEIRIEFVDLSSADATWANYPEELAHAFPESCQVYGRRDMVQVIGDLAEKVKVCSERGDRKQPSTLLVLFGIQRARDIRRETGSLGFGRANEGPNVHANLSTILREGPEAGAHVLLWCDTFQNFSRAFDNAALSEFGHRIVGSLPANDSMKLLDDPVASKITKDNRMIVYNDEKVGVHVHVRPYLPPDVAWLRATLENMKCAMVQESEVR